MSALLFPVSGLQLNLKLNLVNGALRVISLKPLDYGFDILMFFLFVCFLNLKPIPNISQTRSLFSKQVFTHTSESKELKNDYCAFRNSVVVLSARNTYYFVSCCILGSFN